MLTRERFLALPPDRQVATLIALANHVLPVAAADPVADRICRDAVARLNRYRDGLGSATELAANYAHEVEGLDFGVAQFMLGNAAGVYDAFTVVAHASAFAARRAFQLEGGTSIPEPIRLTDAELAAAALGHVEVLVASGLVGEPGESGCHLIR